MSRRRICRRKRLWRDGIGIEGRCGGGGGGGGEEGESEGIVGIGIEMVGEEDDGEGNEDYGRDLDESRSLQNVGSGGLHGYDFLGKNGWKISKKMTFLEV